VRIWGGAADTLVQPAADDVTLEHGTLRVPGFAAAD
jgi:hypothetical protein